MNNVSYNRQCIRAIGLKVVNIIMDARRKLSDGKAFSHCLHIFRRSAFLYHSSQFTSKLSCLCRWRRISTLFGARHQIAWSSLLNLGSQNVLAFLCLLPLTWFFYSRVDWGLEPDHATDLIGTAPGPSGYVDGTLLIMARTQLSHREIFAAFWCFLLLL